MNREEIDKQAEQEGAALRRMREYNPARINKSTARCFKFTKTKHTGISAGQDKFDRLFRK